MTRRPEFESVKAGTSAWPRPGADRVLLLALAGVLLWIAGDVFLVIFTGILLAIGLNGIATALSRHVHVSRRLALFVTAIVTLGTLAGLGTMIVPRVVGQIDQLWNLIVDVIEAVQDALIGWGLPEEITAMDEMGQERLMDFAGTLAGRVAGVTMAAIGTIGAMFVVVAIALFTSYDPDLYRRGFLALLPARREAWDDALSGVAHALRWWFLGQLVSMSVLGVTVSLGLMLIGVDLWLSLGVLTGLLTFIPVLGPIIAGAPILLVGFSEGTNVGLAVLAFYLVIQNLEGNFLVPYIQKRAVHLPPALLISMQVLFGALFGITGFILAAPLTVVGMVLVQRLYVPANDAAG